VKPSLVVHKITPSRCRARNRCRGSFFDPVTFDFTATSAGAVFADAESPEQVDVGGVDEVQYPLTVVSVTWLILGFADP
jgi:hypothetical protein